MSSETTELGRELLDRLKCEGPLTFRDFMEFALYHPERGYYNTERLKIGALGDYYTSSNVHPAFGGVLANAFAQLFAQISSEANQHFRVTFVEVGAGTGQLAADILNAMRNEHQPLFDKLRYVIVEASAAMRTRQQEKLKEFSDRIEWRDLDELLRAPISGIVFSNEFIDALPVHRVRFVNGRLEEAYVSAGIEGSTEHFVYQWSEPSTSRLTEYLDRSGVSLVEGQMLEIGLDAVDWVLKATGILDTGFLVTIDYGDQAAFLYGSDRREGTLRSFYRHQLTDSVLDRVGEQDITASVNFTALGDYGREKGLETVSYERQASFLFRNGLIERIADMEKAAIEEQDVSAHLAVKNLFVPGGVSDNFRVLVQRKVPAE